MSAGDEKPRTHSKRPRALTVVFVVVIVVLVALSATLAVMFTVPLKSVERTDADWFGANLVTLSSGEGAHFYFDPSFFCTPSNAIGNLTISVVWQSSVTNTTVRWGWLVIGPPPNETNWIIYWSNGTSSGGYSFPPTLSDYICQSGVLLTCLWLTPQAGALITLTGVKEYNYTATVPIW